MKYAVYFAFFLANYLAFGAETASYKSLVNAEYFSPIRCIVSSKEGTDFYYTKNYYEFAKICNMPVKSAAIEEFKKLYKFAESDAAKAWALYGLTAMGETVEPPKDLKPVYFCGQLGPLGKVWPNYFKGKKDIEIPDVYIKVNLAEVAEVADKTKYAYLVLQKNGMYITGPRGGGGIVCAETWAYNYLAANKTPEEICKVAEAVWNSAEHFAGKLYALLLFKKANATEKFNEYYKLLDKTKKFTHISGCMFYFSSLGELDKPDWIFNISSAFDEYYEKFPTWFYNPFDENNKRIPLITPKFEIVQSAVREDNLGYLPTRFRDGKDGNVLKYPALAKLAKEWDCAESQSRKNTLQNLLKFMDATAPNRVLAHYEYGFAIAAVKENSAWVFKKPAKIMFGQEPCFDDYYMNAPIQQLAKKIFAYALYGEIEEKGGESLVGFCFGRANRQVLLCFGYGLDCLDRQGKTQVEKIEKRFEELGEYAEVLCLENSQNENNVWLCPIFKKCNKQKLAELKAKHLKILGLLSKEQRQKYDELHEKYPAITDL